jgi:predicted enzyme involved in methoxymalonyl-ACP biosynthesis
MKINRFHITLYATLDDKFGSNGIVSAFIGEIEAGESGHVLHIRLWVMSCRVFKRELEQAVFDRVVNICKSKGLAKLAGYYFKTEKNGYAAGLLGELGFVKKTDEIWEYSLSEYHNKNKYIETEKDVNR